MRKGKWFLLLMMIMVFIGYYHLVDTVSYWLLVPVLLYALWKLWGMRGRIKKTKWHDWLNPVRWTQVLYADLLSIIFPPYILEQYMLRVFDEECRKCVANGSCLDCGCAVPEKMYLDGSSCSLGYWGEMIQNKEEYEDHRDRYPVEITIKYLKEKGNE